MLKDYRLMPEEPESEGDGKKLFLHTVGVLLAFLPGAAFLYLFILFGAGKEEVRIIWAVLAVCSLGAIMLVFAGKFGIAYVVAIAPFPAIYLVSVFLSGPTTRKWTEDVLLDDGSIIQVKRMVKFNESNSVSGDAYNAVETDAMISFTGDLKELPSWRVPLMPIVMYQDKGTKEWVVVAMTTSTDVWHRHGRPCPKYWEYRLNDDGWHKVPLSPTSIGRPANLLHRYQSKLGTSHITIQDRERRESDPGIGERFKKIISAEEAGCAAHQPNA